MPWDLRNPPTDFVILVCVIFPSRQEPFELPMHQEKSPVKQRRKLVVIIWWEVKIVMKLWELYNPIKSSFFQQQKVPHKVDKNERESSLVSGQLYL